MPKNPIYESNTLLLQPSLQSSYRQIIRDYPKGVTALLLQNYLHILQNTSMKIGTYDKQQHLVYAPAVRQFYDSIEKSIAPLLHGLVEGGFSK